MTLVFHPPLIWMANPGRGFARGAIDPNRHQLRRGNDGQPHFPTLPDGLPDQSSSTDEQWLRENAGRQVAYVKATACDTPIRDTLLRTITTKDPTELQRIPNE